MAFTYGFYNALDHDRLYDAKEMSRIFDGLITDGIYAEVGNKFIVRASSEANSVIIGSGRAWFNYTWNYNDSDMILTGPAPHAVYNRWDAIVIDVQSDDSHRENSIQWITGTASASPTKPSLIHTADHNQYPLAYIYRYANTTSITAGNISSTVGKSECPYCSGLLVDTKNIAPVEENDTASRQYNQGEYILWHSELYRVTTTILINAIIIAYPSSGYNVKRTTISEELYNTFVMDTKPTSGSLHPVNSDGIYRALGGNQIIEPTTSVNQNDPTNGKSVITSKGLYAALGNRTSIQTSAPTQNSNNLITSGQVYTALGNRTNIQTSAPASGGNNLITNGQVYTALGNRTTLGTSGGMCEIKGITFFDYTATEANRNDRTKGINVNDFCLPLIGSFSDWSVEGDFSKYKNAYTDFSRLHYTVYRYDGKSGSNWNSTYMWVYWILFITVSLSPNKLSLRGSWKSDAPNGDIENNDYVLKSLAGDIIFELK